MHALHAGTFHTSAFSERHICAACHPGSEVLAHCQHREACLLFLECFGLGLQSINGTEVVLTKPLGQAKGVVLLFHGCQHSALDWGQTSPTCPLCLGRPFTLAASVALLTWSQSVSCASN